MTLSTGKTHTPRRKTPLRLVAMATAFAALSACTTDFIGTTASSEGIKFRSSRNAEIMASRSWRDCRDEALMIDAQARKTASAAKYATSARALETCESNLSDVSQIMPLERMQAYAVSVQNYLKAGDVASARGNLESFKTAFAGKDLYFPDGSSFVQTMDLVLGLADKTDAAPYSVANISSEMKREIRRMRYWKSM